MARARNIKPGFFRNENLGECSPLARLLFAGLWCEADREGRLEDRPKRIKAEILPYDDCDVSKLLGELESAGFVVRYQHGNGRYIQVLNFSKHQNPHVKEGASVIPAPDLSGASPVQAPDKDSPKPERAGLIPDSLIPDSGFPHPDSLIPDPPTEATALQPASPGRTPKAPVAPSENKSTWLGYSAAYRERYGAEPVRNATVNSQMASFVKRIGCEEAPEVAAHYVRNSSAFYVTKGHPVGLLLSDAEKLRTEWATNRTINGTTARRQEATAANPFLALLDGTHG